VVILEHLAILRALVADRCTQCAKLLRVLRVHRHKPARIRADAGTFHQRIDALLSRLYIRLVQAHTGAFMACLRAAGAGIDTFLILVCGVCHNTHSCSPPFFLL
jgi:hypothetical protein